MRPHKLVRAAVASDALGGDPSAEQALEEGLHRTAKCRRSQAEKENDGAGGAGQRDSVQVRRGG